MIARCAKCQNTFNTERYGSQFCPSCGAEVFLRDPNAPVAPAGAATASSAELPAGGSAAAPPPAAEFATPSGGGAPWEERGQSSLVSAFIETAKRSVTQPGTFFKSLRTDPVGGAISFGLICWIVGWFASELWEIATSSLVPSENLLKILPQSADSEMMIKRMAEWSSPKVRLVSALSSPVGAVISFFVIAVVLHLMVVLVCRGGRGWSATFRALGYASAPLLLGIVPVCGQELGVIWSIILTIIGVTHLHKTTGGRAAAAVLLPMVLVCCCSCVGLLVVGIGAGAMGSAFMSGH
jgi:hypothetical protein